MIVPKSPVPCIFSQPDKDHLWLFLYEVTGHLRPRISLEEYKELFEDVWRDRARAVGWDIRFEYDQHDTRMILDASSPATMDSRL